MSVDLYIYTSSTTLIRPKELTAGTEDAEWEFALVTGEQSLFPASSTSQCLVVGWRPGSSSGERARRAISNRDARQLDTIFRENLAGVVELRTEQSFTADAEALVELRKAGVSPSHIERIQAAKMRYVVGTSASRNALSLELQHDVWLLIGVLTDGLCEDPQGGEFIDAAEESESEE
jgi:hypothetical protein